MTQPANMLSELVTTSSMLLSVEPMYTLRVCVGRSPNMLARIYLWVERLDTEKTAFWRPNGTGVSLASTTILKACCPAITLCKDLMYSVCCRNDLIWLASTCLHRT